MGIRKKNWLSSLKRGARLVVTLLSAILLCSATHSLTFQFVASALTILGGEDSGECMGGEETREASPKLIRLRAGNLQDHCTARYGSRARNILEGRLAIQQQPTLPAPVNSGAGIHILC